MIQAKFKENDYNYGYNNLNTQKEEKLNFKTVLTFVITLIIIGAIVVAYIGHSLQITHLNYRLSELKDKLNGINEEIQELNLELESGRSLARVERIARTRLSMVDPEQVEVVVLNDIDQELKPVDNKRETLFLVKAFNNLIDRLGTVKAGDLF